MKVEYLILFASTTNNIIAEVTENLYTPINEGLIGSDKVSDNLIINKNINSCINKLRTVI